MTGIETPWTIERGRILLRIARQSLSEALGFGEGPGGWDDPWLREPGATFVTLRRRGNLRGCVGSIQAYRSLSDDVWLNARASAFHDSRFPPVEPRE
ncbi:MAG TPA: AMMECR1 domain-containing protein, partial [Thermoanaerobaculia bacterium]